MGKIKSEQEVYNDTSGKTAIYQGVQPWQKKKDSVGYLLQPTFIVEMAQD